jgi:outer membrane protein OmpA-like peptidoglycan-associated protein
MNRQYLSIADLMSGLMMIFLFIAIAFMINVQRQNDAMTKIASISEQARKNLHHDLSIEFKSDLKNWNAEILKDNTIRFKSPNVLFETGKSELGVNFKAILNIFFPRYIKIIQTYNDEDKAIQIEGHTSSDWLNSTNINIRYIKNVELSQQRALSTLKYCYSLFANQARQRDWLQQVLKANGLSFSKRIFNADGSENAEKSRRVEFKIVTKAEEKLHQILKQSQREFAEWQ